MTRHINRKKHMQKKARRHTAVLLHRQGGRCYWCGLPIVHFAVIKAADPST